jgi:hypothetical protein
MDEALGILVAEIPLGVAADARPVVEKAKQRGDLALAGRHEHLALALGEVAVPQAVDVGDLEGALLSRHETGLLLVAAQPASFAEPVVFHVAADGRVAWQRQELRVLSGERAEIVVDELVGPTRVLLA